MGTQCLKLQRGVTRIRIVLLAGFVAIALLGGCGASMSVHAVDQGLAGLDERVMEVSRWSAEIDREGADPVTGEPVVSLATSDDYLIGAPIPQHGIYRGDLQRESFNLYPLFQDSRLVARQYVDDCLDADPSVSGNYPRVIWDDLEVYGELIAGGEPLAEVTLIGEGYEEQWIVRPDGTGILVHDDTHGASINDGLEEEPIVKQVPEEIAAVIDQLEFSDPAQFREFSLERE